MNPAVKATVVAFVPLAVCLSLVSSASAEPAVGSSRPATVKLEDAWDRPIDLGSYTVPMLLLYEDKASVTLNRALKADLARLAAGDRYKSRIALVPIADVTGYDYWPVRGFVKDAIQAESHKQKTVIYCDWNGQARTALGLQRGTSNVVLFGRGGKVLFAHAGILSNEQRTELLALLRDQVDNA